MSFSRSSLACLSLVTAACSLMACAVGCDKQETSSPGGPPAMRGPGGPGGPRGGPVAANASGGEIYAQKCQGCHGAAGNGGRAPSLAGIADPADALAQTIHDGKGRMPAFGSQLSDEQIKKVVDYLKGLGKAGAA